MASKTITHLIDDIDGSEAELTVPFALDGKSYVIDLNATHSAEFLAALKPYTDVARRADVGQPTKPRRPRTGNPGAVREWAQDNGHRVAPRGRIPAAVVAAYQAAQAA